MVIKQELQISNFAASLGSADNLGCVASLGSAASLGRSQAGNTAIANMECYIN